MTRRASVLVLLAAAFAAMVVPAFGATPVARIKKLERQVRGLIALQLLHDQVATVTIEVPVVWQQSYGTATAFCPPGSAATGGGVRWVGQFGIDSAIIASYGSGISWTVGVRGGAGTTGVAMAQAVCSRLQ